ncbi:MAG: hypothetical protein EXR72_03555 [Myxococcales bacterium]|nr:hypothetical protein [Myxococcales bacterium]
MAQLANLLDTPDVTLTTIEAHLDALASEQRVVECRALSKSQLAKLWEVSAPAPRLGLEDFVPVAAPDDQPVRFCGKNSLPAFTHFEKHFVRRAGAVVGINVGSTSFATGPGYFTCEVMSERPNEVLFDYTRVPPSGPPGWPAPRSNRSGISFFVYRDMHDYNRRVSKDVVIGAATRLGTPIGQYYVLARAAS